MSKLKLHLQGISKNTALSVRDWAMFIAPVLMLLDIDFIPFIEWIEVITVGLIPASHIVSRLALNMRDIEVEYDPF